jgi:hypothetical protein
MILVYAKTTNHQSLITNHQSIRFTLNNNLLSELADADGNLIGGLKLFIPDPRTNGETERWQNGKILCYPNPVCEALNIELETLNLKP